MPDRSNSQMLEIVQTVAHQRRRRLLSLDPDTITQAIMDRFQRARFQPGFSIINWLVAQFDEMDIEATECAHG